MGFHRSSVPGMLFSCLGCCCFLEEGPALLEEWLVLLCPRCWVDASEPPQVLVLIGFSLCQPGSLAALLLSAPAAGGRTGNCGGRLWDRQSTGLTCLACPRIVPGLLMETVAGESHALPTRQQAH